MCYNKTAMKYCIAIDIGASSGRHIVGWRNADGNIETDEVYRFANGAVRERGRLVWDVRALYENAVAGIKAAFAKYPSIDSLAIDTWGVDYVLMNGDDEILPCYSYRDERTGAAVERVHSVTPFNELYSKTGIQFQPFNTVYQLYSDLVENRLGNATDFLMIPEYLTYKLTGIKVHEYTNATTTGLVEADTKEYSKDIIKRLDLPVGLFDKLFRPGAVVGRLKKEVRDITGGDLDVMLCASHDTASAVEGIPMTGNKPYISSGTWSLIGVKTEKAITSESARSANYSNEGGVGYIRFQKNIAGMWVVNKLRDELCRGKDFGEIVKEASASDFAEHVDLNDPVFLSPESMKFAFDGLLKRKPQCAADYFNSAFISIAHCYKQALDELKAVVGEPYDELYIVGGGAKNGYLNSLTEKICGVKVIALPIEATAIGNLKLQLTEK